MGRPKPRPRRQFPPSKARAPQTCYTAIMNLTQRPPNVPITPTMSTCSEEKPAQSPPAALPTVCAAATGKKSARASHGAPAPPPATAAAKNAATTAMPAPPAAPKRICAANAHLDLSSKNRSHRLCRPLCRKHQNAPFFKKLRAFFKKNRPKTSSYLSCHERSHLYPVTEQKILAKNQHLLTTFAAIRYSFDTLSVCPQPPAIDAAPSRPGHSWPRPAPPSPRAAAPPARRSSPSSTTVSRAEMLHCAAWPQVRFSAPGPLDSPAPGWTRRIITNTPKSQAHGGASQIFVQSLSESGIEGFVDLQDSRRSPDFYAAGHFTCAEKGHRNGTIIWDRPAEEGWLPDCGANVARISIYVIWEWVRSGEMDEFSRGWKVEDDRIMAA